MNEKAADEKAARPMVGVGLVLIRDGKVFLGKRRGSHGEETWGSAGGHLEFGESLEGCARREAMEELGVSVGDLRFLCLSNIIAYGRHYVDVEFLGELGDQEPEPTDSGAFSESGWFLVDDPPRADEAGAGKRTHRRLLLCQVVGSTRFQTRASPPCRSCGAAYRAKLRCSRSPRR